MGGRLQITVNISVKKFPFLIGKTPTEDADISKFDGKESVDDEENTSNLPTNSEDEDSAVLAQLENVIAQKLKKGKEPKKQKSSHQQHQQDLPDPSLLCVPGKKSHVQRLEKSSQDFKPSDESDAQVLSLKIVNLVIT